MGESALTSTPGSIDAVDISLLIDIMGQFGTQIGMSILARLMSAGVVNVNSEHPSGESLNTSPTHTVTHSSTNRQINSQVTLHLKLDKEPKLFRSDSSDKYPVQDWINMTKAYLRKQKCPVDEQAEEIMGKLMGKGRDLVRVALHSDKTLDPTLDPNVLFDIFLQYFSDMQSCLPVTDFSDMARAKLIIG